ncbi:hypothetical protein QYE76_040088 [Lolium multiflorum]|uniref:Uncharacterized protein n=1 Tax=Lolium multiflorum TaxID=4521 RepID=A0AAD8TB44_LOLMU|nr:hypothetical protein QYE76_040088 [Lolium multiflorum]
MHAVARAEKFDARWKMMLKNHSVQIDLLKATTTTKKRNTDWTFLMAANPEVMNEKVHAWYASQRDIVLNQRAEGEPATAASSPTLMLISTPDTSAPSTAAMPSPQEEQPVIVIADDEPSVANAEEAAAIDEEPVFLIEEAETTAI